MLQHKLPYSALNQNITKYYAYQRATAESTVRLLIAHTTSTPNIRYRKSKNAY